MIITYRPEGAEPQDFTFRIRKLLTPEAEAIEDLGGSRWSTIAEYGIRLMMGDMRAMRAALWTVLRRKNPGLEFDQLHICVDDVDLNWEPDEAAQLRSQLTSDASLPADEVDAMLKAFGVADAGEPDPKEPAA